MGIEILLTPRDLGVLLAILSIILLLSSLLIKENSIINKEHLELAAKIVGLAFLGVAFYLMWQSIA